jgi:hypothetical protein
MSLLPDPFFKFEPPILVHHFVLSTGKMCGVWQDPAGAITVLKKTQADYSGGGQRPK